MMKRAPLLSSGGAFVFFRDESVGFIMRVEKSLTNINHAGLRSFFSVVRIDSF